MKIVYDNIIFSLQRAGGISAYWSELIQRLLRTDDLVTYYGNPGSDNILQSQISFPEQRESFIPTPLLRYLPFTRPVPSDSLFHSSYYRPPFSSHARSVVTVHDFTYERFSSGVRKFVHSRQKHFALSRATGIICVSENTRRDLLHFFPDIDPSRIRVIHNGVSDSFHPTPREHFFNEPLIASLRPQRYVLFVGGRTGYKNFSLAVDVLSSFPDLSLVIVGPPLTPHEQHKLDSVLPSRYSLFTHISEHILNLLYGHSVCLLYPSLYEGFGIPILEAMRAGCPVLATHTSSIPEVAGNAGILVRPDDTPGFVSGVHQLLDQSTRQTYIDLGLERSKHFSWDRCFEETYSFYRDLLQ